MKQKYSEAFIEQAVVKLLSRGKRTVREVALELNVSYHTAKNWMKRGHPDRAGTLSSKEVDFRLAKSEYSVVERNFR